MNWRRLLALTRREIIQIIRDRRFVVLFLGLAFLQLFVYAYSASKTVYHMPLAVVDQSRTPRSQGFVQALVNSGYFDLSMYLDSHDAVVRAIDSGQIRAGIVIPADFASELNRGSAAVQVVLDGSDQFSASSAYGAVATIAESYGRQLLSGRVGGTTTGPNSPITAFQRVLYNPDLNDKWYVIPGIIGMILQTLAIEQAAILLVRDREWGTLEQILAAPVKATELILSKLIPLLLLCVLVLGLSLAMGILWFGVPFRGSLPLYLWLALLFMSSCLGLGILISTRAKTQFEADASSMVFMLFGLLLSGLFYPRIGMPLIPQLIGDLAPLTYFLRISRGIYTKGLGIRFIWADAAALGIYLVIVVVLASRRFKMRLD